MKFVVISDTHGLHEQLDLPDGDVLLHAGDISMRGTNTETISFLSWFSAQPHPYKIFIAGNHDHFFENQSAATIQAILPENIIYLNDQLLEFEGFRIWGSPFTPICLTARHRWAFIRQRGEDIKKHWDLIPENLDILMVHGPAHGILDITLKNEHVGCEELLKAVEAKKPSKFIFGHIHESSGQLQRGSVHFMNASSVDRHRTMMKAPIVFELEKPSLAGQATNQ